MRGINATPKPTSRRGRPSAKLLHPWDAPGLSRAEKVIRFVETLPCTAGPARRYDPETAAVAKTLRQGRLPHGQGAQSCGPNGRPECGSKEREDSVSGRLVS